LIASIKRMVTFETLVVAVYNLPHRALQQLPIMGAKEKEFVSELTVSTVEHIEREYLKALTPIQIVIGTLLTMVALNFVKQFVDALRSLTFEKVKQSGFRLAMNIPMVAAQVHE